VSTAPPPQPAAYYLSRGFLHFVRETAAAPFTTWCGLTFYVPADALLRTRPTETDPAWHPICRICGLKFSQLARVPIPSTTKETAT
jgi:hypothetical protein